ncbi:MAG: hypothetical protein ACI80V_000012 [Rhodothermales bacterium]|jgi:hypothetical protein
MRYMLHRLLAALFAFATVLPAAGQALPDLAPRDVEIRGELTISFPSLRRQPLVGFNPPPRVPDIGLRRMPFVERYKQRGTELPQNPLANPTTPRDLPRTAGSGFTGTFETGFGRYATRYALLEASLFASPVSRWTVAGRYDGTTSFAPFGSDAAADGFTGSTRFASSGPSVSYGVEALGSSDSYTLYGIDLPGSVGTVVAPNRTRSDLLGSAWLGTGSASSVSLNLRLDGYSGSNSTGAFVGTVDSRNERSNSGAKATLSMQASAVKLDASAGALTLDSASNPGRAVGHYDAGGAFKLRLGSTASAEFGGRVLGFEALPVASGSTRRSISYFSPSMELEAALAPNLRLEVSQRPSLGSANPGDLFRDQPFLVDEVQIEPVIYTVDAMARLRGFWSTLQASAIVGYKESPNWRVFEHDSANFTGYPQGLSRVRHTAARVVTVGGEMRLSPTPGFEARLGGRFQNGRLTDLKTDLPYLPDWTVEGMISQAFAKRKGLVQATTALLGKRPRDTVGGEPVSTFADLDVRISYAVATNGLVIAELRNLLGETPYWYNYPEAPATVVVGLGWRW